MDVKVLALGCATNASVAQIALRGGESRTRQQDPRAKCDGERWMRRTSGRASGRMDFAGPRRNVARHEVTDVGRWCRFGHLTA